MNVDDPVGPDDHAQASDRSNATFWTPPTHGSNDGHKINHPVLSLFNWAKGQPSVAVVITTGLATLAGAVAAQRYYEKFGLSPREVGYTPSDYVATAALLFAFSAVATSLAVLQGYHTAEQFRSDVSRGRRVASGSIAVACVLAAVLGTAFYTDSWMYQSIFLTYIAIASSTARARITTDFRREEMPPAAFAFAIAIGASITSIGFLFMSGAGWAANATMRSGAASPVVLSLGVRMSTSIVSGMGDTSIDGRCVLYLGGADGKAVLWVPDEDTATKVDGATHIVPSANLVRITGCDYQP